MPRHSRRNLSSNYFHVMVQGINKEYIFNTNKNINRYKKIIIENYQDYKECKLTILSYCFMNNHSHFIFFCENFPVLSKFMQKINSSYAVYYNKVQNRVGYVFRDRFKVQEIKSFEQLHNCIRYIHNNPVKAKICNSMSDYEFSSYNEFLGIKKIISNKSIELIFGHTDNYENKFKLMHQTHDNDYFLDVKDVSLSDFVSRFLDENNIMISDISNNALLLTQFVKQAKNETTATFTDLSNLLNISKGKIGYHYRK